MRLFLWYCRVAGIRRKGRDSPSEAYYVKLEYLAAKHGQFISDLKFHCKVTATFGTVFRRACDTDFPEDYHDVQRIADVVREYVGGIDTAQPIKAEGLNDLYKILCKMNGTILAGMETQRHGYIFTTWNCSEDVTSLYNGHYHMENYTAAKEDFAVRSGLIAENHLFTNEQLKKIQDSVKYCMNENGCLTDRQYDDLGAIVEQIEQILPLSESLGEENDIHMGGQRFP